MILKAELTSRNGEKRTVAISDLTMMPTTWRKAEKKVTYEETSIKTLDAFVIELLKSNFCLVINVVLL